MTGTPEAMLGELGEGSESRKVESLREGLAVLIDLVREAEQHKNLQPSVEQKIYVLLELWRHINEAYLLGNNVVLHFGDGDIVLDEIHRQTHAKKYRQDEASGSPRNNWMTVKYTESQQPPDSKLVGLGGTDYWSIIPPERLWAIISEGNAQLSLKPLGENPFPHEPYICVNMPKEQAWGESSRINRL